MNDFDFSQTYLYKMHRLTNSLDEAFDKSLREHAGIGLSQFTLLLSVQQYQPVTQRAVAHFLAVSAGAVSRQVDIALTNGWIEVKTDTKDRRKQQLVLTEDGKQMIDRGGVELEKLVFRIFDDDELMGHIDHLQRNIDRLGS